MKKLVFVSLLTLSLSCTSNQKTQKEMGFFDKLFGSKKQTKALQELVQQSDQLMEADKFWQIIARTKDEPSGNYEKQQTALFKELDKLSALEILEFDNRFRKLRGDAYTWDFWAAAYIINGGCSDDCFSDFRGWLIGQGKVIFESALQDVDSLSELNETNDGDWEGLSYVAMEVYEKKTGKDMPSGIQENFEITGEEWNEEGDELKIRFPKLWAKFGL